VPGWSNGPVNNIFKMAKAICVSHLRSKLKILQNQAGIFISAMPQFKNNRAASAKEISRLSARFSIAFRCEPLNFRARESFSRTFCISSPMSEEFLSSIV
jgi:hypothetical protein